MALAALGSFSAHNIRQEDPSVCPSFGFGVRRFCGGAVFKRALRLPARARSLARLSVKLSMIPQRQRTRMRRDGDDGGGGGARASYTLLTPHSLTPAERLRLRDGWRFGGPARMNEP